METLASLLPSGDLAGYSETHYIHVQAAHTGGLLDRSGEITKSQQVIPIPQGRPHSWRLGFSKSKVFGEGSDFALSRQWWHFYGGQCGQASSGAVIFILPFRCLFQATCLVPSVAVMKVSCTWPSALRACTFLNGLFQARHAFLSQPLSFIY